MIMPHTYTIVYFNCKNQLEMIAPCRLDISWMKSLCQSHINTTIIKFHIMCFVIQIIYDLSKATKRLCNCMWQL